MAPAAPSDRAVTRFHALTRRNIDIRTPDTDASRQHESSLSTGGTRRRLSFRRGLRFNPLWRHPPPLPFIAALATDYCWVLLLLSILWLVYALRAERNFQSRFAREALPLGLGAAGAMFFFFFPSLACVLTLMLPTHLHG